MNQSVYVKSPWSFLFPCWPGGRPCLLDVMLISALGEGLAMSLQSVRCSLERRLEMRPYCCWSLLWPSGLRAEPRSSDLYSNLSITHRMGYTNIWCSLPPDYAVFTQRVGLAAYCCSLSCTRSVGKMCIESGYLDQTPVCRAVLSPRELTADCHSKEATWSKTTTDVVSCDQCLSGCIWHTRKM